MESKPEPEPEQQQINLSTAQTNKNNKIISNNKPLMKNSITKKTSLKYYRAQAVERVGKVVNMLPQFIKFIKKLTPEQIAALKYFKGYGSFFQTDFLINHNNIPINAAKPTKPIKANFGNGLSRMTSNKKTHELSFPFTKYADESLQIDILGSRVLLQYPLWLPNMTDIQSYINNSYGIRIELLNILDTIFSHLECPKLNANTILFRGMRNVSDKKKIKAGEIIEFKNFISTTYDRLVAERFSGNNYMFVLSGFDNVPCLYTPNFKTGDNYTSVIIENSITNDLSELTLPRGIEFKIDKVELRHMSTDRHAIPFHTKKTATYRTLMGVLKNKGLAPDDVNNTIEDAFYNKATFVYCSFVKWTPQAPIDFKKIKKTAKFVLDTNALMTWSHNDDYESDD